MTSLEEEMLRRTTQTASGMEFTVAVPVALNIIYEELLQIKALLKPDIRSQCERENK